MSSELRLQFAVAATLDGPSSTTHCRRASYSVVQRGLQMNLTNEERQALGSASRSTLAAAWGIGSSLRESEAAGAQQRQNDRECTDELLHRRSLLIGKVQSGTP
jgi:hypothetical protein